MLAFTAVDFEFQRRIGGHDVEPIALFGKSGQIELSSVAQSVFGTLLFLVASFTLGRRLVEKRPEVRVLGRMVPVKAEIVVLNGLSSHADHGDLLRMLGPLAPNTRVRLVHGEPDRAAKLAEGLKGIGFADVAIPDRGETAGV